MQKLIWQNADGEEINLTGGNYGITAWEGFSNTSLNIQSQQVPFQDGGVFLDALLEQRELSVTLAIYDGNNLETRYRLRRELIHILNPKLGEGYLIYTNDFTSKRIKCVPQIPLFETHNSNDSGTPKASLSWNACEPYWEDLEETEVVFSVGEFVNINNNGDTPSYLKIELSGSALNPKIQNMSTNKFIEYKNQLQNPIIINTNMGQKKITEEEISFYLSNSNKSISSIVYSSALGIFVAVGSGGVILTSNDGEKWTYQISGVTTNISDIVYAVDKNLFVAITGTSVLTSTDGINWTRTQVIAISFRSIFYSLDLEMFIATANEGSSSYIYTSTDGINWTGKYYSSNLNDIIYSSETNLFVAVGANGTIITSSDGSNWTLRTSGTTRSLYSITYSPVLNLFVTVGRAGTILTSPDGIEWTIRGSGLNISYLYQVIYSASLNIFIVVCSGGKYLTSSDGIEWNENDIGVIYDLEAIVYSEELGLLVVGGTVSYISTSFDCINWVIRKNGLSENLYDSVYDPNAKLFVAVGSGVHSTVLVSVDGENWINRNIVDYGSSLWKITYSNRLKMLVAVGMNGLILTSLDSETWTKRNSYINETLNGVFYSSEKKLFVITGNNGTILTSNDGISWILQSSGVSVILMGISYSSKHGMFVVVGASGTILTSTNGINWVARNSGITTSLKSVAYSLELNIFAAVGESGIILTSTNGIDWVARNSGTTQYINDIKYEQSLGVFVAVGNLGVILTSNDGVNWIQKDKCSTATLYSVSYSEVLNNFLITSLTEKDIVNSELKESQSVIQYLSSDSDMDLNLRVGLNKFRLLKASGSLRTRIIYRQKYLGV